MATRIDTIIKLIQEEAKNRAGNGAYVGKLYDVLQDVLLRVATLVRSIQDRERELEHQKRG